MAPIVLIAAAVAGINFVNPGRFAVDQQNAALAAMKSAGVRVIRCGISPDARGIDFARRVYAQGISIDLIVGMRYRSDAPTRQWQPKAFPQMWGGHPLSSADPELFRAYVTSLVSQLDVNHIKLTALELGNEINWTAFNPEFPLPGEGKGVLSLDDLYHDPEGRQIASGYLQYLKLLAVLKDVRDRSTVNQRTPIITAGLVDAEQGDIRPGSKEDAVSFGATLDFMRANGLDNLVDGYGIHIYPSSNPSTPEQNRMKPLEQASFERECRPVGSIAGKPCWVTEWGVGNRDPGCPPDESNRLTVISQMRDIFERYAQAGQLAGAIYYAWNTDAWSNTADPLSVFRCGSLTPAGRSAIAPL